MSQKERMQITQRSGTLGSSSRPLRIGIVTHGYTHYSSGSEKGAQILCETLSRRGHEVHVFTSYHDDYPDSLNGVYLHPVLNRSLKSQRRLVYEYVNAASTIAKIILSARKYRLQILNVHDSEGYGVFTGLAGKALKIPVILTWTQGDLMFEGSKSLGKHLLYYNRRLKARLGLGLADRVVVKGIPVEVFRLAYPSAEQKLYQAPNPIRVPEAPEAYEDPGLVSGYHLDKGFIVATVATRMEVTKGIDDFLKAGKWLKDHGETSVKLLMIGGRVERQLVPWREKIKEYGIEDLVTFAGFQPNIYPFLYSSDVYVVGGIGELGWGRAQLEAMAMELPVISRRTRTFEYWFKHLHDVYLVDEMSPEALARAVLDLKKDERLRCFMGKNAREAVLRDWDIEAFADQFLDLCRAEVRQTSLPPQRIHHAVF